MLTPQEVSKRSFSKAAFGGYNMGMVDEFLDELTEDYSTLYKENAALKAKMKILVDKVEEYRSTEDSMRAALLTAQKMADSMVSEAEERKASLLADAEAEAKKKLAELDQQIRDEQAKLDAVKTQTAEFLSQIETLCGEQLRLIAAAPDTTVEKQEPAHKTDVHEADISSIEEKILASFRADAAQSAAPAEEPAAPAEEPAEAAAASAPADDAESEPFVDDATRTFKLDNLQFGRNYPKE